MKYEPPGSLSQSELPEDYDGRGPHFSPRAPTHPILNLQRTVGNRGVQRLVQTKLTAERSPGQTGAEADHLPEPIGGSPIIVQRQCACGGTAGPDGECPQCREKRLLLQSSARTSDRTELEAKGIFGAGRAGIRTLARVAVDSTQDAGKVYRTAKLASRLTEDEVQAAENLVAGARPTPPQLKMARNLQEMETGISAESVPLEPLEPVEKGTAKVAKATSADLEKIRQMTHLAGKDHILSLKRTGRQLFPWLCSNGCGPLIRKAEAMIERLPAGHDAARAELKEFVESVRANATWIDVEPEEATAVQVLKNLTEELEGIEKRFPGAVEPDIHVSSEPPTPTKAVPAAHDPTQAPPGTPRKLPDPTGRRVTTEHTNRARPSTAGTHEIGVARKARQAAAADLREQIARTEALQSRMRQLASKFERTIKNLPQSEREFLENTALSIDERYSRVLKEFSEADIEEMEHLRTQLRRELRIRGRELDDFILDEMVRLHLIPDLEYYVFRNFGPLVQLSR
jgi:hypothetical protein